MESFIIARVLHVLGIVFWIGGVAMVTTVLLSVVRTLKSPLEQQEFFASLESGFAKQARITTLITGLSGFYLVHSLDAWDRYAQLQYWWLHAMTLIWFLFTMVLFVLEPLFLHRWFQSAAKKEPVKTFALIQKMHWLLLALSLITVAGAVAGSHGWVFAVSA
ncbi:MAG: hypothetical protein GY862_30085 [Gammaproteobacteria bacterium]|nr:hypothetical protein [Gammaproteobacteria bacterium]